MIKWLFMLFRTRESKPSLLVYSIAAFTGTRGYPKSTD